MNIHPSILSIDTDHLQQEVDSVVDLSDGIHVDVMDGGFVPTHGIKADDIRDLDISIPMDVHLMVDRPSEFFEDFIRVPGVSAIAFHLESHEDIHANIQALRNAGISPGLAINPETPAENLENYLLEIDYVIVMTVVPGRGGQAFMPEMLDKVHQLKHERPELKIMIDGGVDPSNARLCHEAGADILVAGTAIFSSDDRESVISAFRSVSNN